MRIIYWTEHGSDNSRNYPLMEKLSCSRRSREAWTALEDEHLREYVKTHGRGKWSNVSQETGLQRSGKSCRLRWLNYLRPDIKRGNMSPEEEDLIIRLHKLLGNRWSLIAGRLPGRSDNEIKNYWNTTLVKRVEKEKEKDKDKEAPKMDGGLVNNAAAMKRKSCELWADPMTEDYPPDPSMNFPENLFQHEDHTVSDCDHLWNNWNSNFSHFDDHHGIWGNGNSSTAAGANALWSDFFT